VSAPDALAVLRALAGVPILIALAFDARAVAFAIFALAAVSDALDGWLARRQGTTTDHGVLLDPLADKALVIATLAGLAVVGAAPLALVAAVTARELFVSGLRVIRHRAGGYLPAAKLAKLKTALEMCAIAALIVARPAAFEAAFAVGLLVAALAIGLATLPTYFPHKRQRYTT
jgi:CDP-diacylglycerol--glycerol-3-phosphate 3-phosphatidyltransferase